MAGSKLHGMTLEEFWRLFPITLIPHHSAWNGWYEEEAAEIRRILGGTAVLGIHHVGSTAVPEIDAKNIVDILLELPDRSVMAEAAAKLAEAGWLEMSRSENRISLNKGYTETGFAPKVYHLHLRLPNDCAEILFRDYLVSHPKTAKEYEKLKRTLAEKYKFNRDAYTEAKTEFVTRYTKLAEKEKTETE